jgi:hypothetical protein
MEGLTENGDDNRNTALVVKEEPRATEMVQEQLEANLEMSKMLQSSPGLQRKCNNIDSDTGKYLHFNIDSSQTRFRKLIKFNKNDLLMGLVLYNDGKTGEVIVMEGRGNHIVTWCGEELDGSHLNISSAYGLSPFAILLTHQDAPLSSVLKLYSRIRNCSEVDKRR